MYNEFLVGLKNTYPKTWAEFALVAEEVLKSSSATAHLEAEVLPFDLAFGILLRFFKENELEFDYDNLAPNQFQEEIKNLFGSFEGIIGHYS